MQLGHSHRQLLSRCTLRWYSVGTGSDAVPSSDTPVSPRLKRPLASTFGGINIQNVVVPMQSASKSFRNRPTRSNGSDDQSPDVRRMSQPDRNRGKGRGGASSRSAWGDGLVSLSFASRLNQRQERSTTRDKGTESQLQGAQSRKEKSYQAQRPQMDGRRHGQKQHEHNTSQTSRLSQRQERSTTRDKGTESQLQEAQSRKENSYKAQRPQMDGRRHGQRQHEHNTSQTRRHGGTERSASASAIQQGNRASAPSTNAQNSKPKTSSMTRPSSQSTFNRHPKSTTSTTAATKTSASDATTTTTQQPTTVLSGYKARLAMLSSTNLNALFRTTTNTNTPNTGVSLHSLHTLPASTTVSAPDSARARVRSVLERSAGDYSRFLPRHFGMHKNSSHLPAFRTARHALATQRDVSLEQRRAALHIIGGLVKSRREAHA